jgi:Uma2 family endonuclease
MGKITTRTSELKRFLRLPEFKPALEFIGGRIIQKMSPMLPDSVIQLDLASALNAFARPRKLGRAYTELRAVFGGAAQVPDISFFRADRVPKLVPGEKVPILLIPPDIAVEISSPGQTTAFLRRKLRHTIRHGSKLGWLIKPKRKEIEILRSGLDPEILKVGDVLSGEDVLPGFSLTLEEIFGWLYQD